MATNQYQLITSNTLQTEPSQISPVLDSSPQDSPRQPLRDTQGFEDDNSSPLISTRTGNATEREEAGLIIKPVETTEINIIDELPKRAPRRRFYSHAEAKTSKDNAEDNQIPTGRLNTFQNEAEGLDNKKKGDESPMSGNSMNENGDSEKSIKPSRFRRKMTYDFSGSLNESGGESPMKTPDFLEQSKRNRLRSGASTLLRKVSLTPKPPSTSLTFDAIVDKQKGVETIKTNYPTYKTDKRLIFLGKRFKYPSFVIPYKSFFRKFWNLCIILIILYQVFWHPLDNTFLLDEDPLLGIRITEWILLGVFLTDVFFNMRTTYLNANNEEIIDLKMIRKNYMNKSDFILDVVTLFPLGEILFYSISHQEHRRLFYSIPKLLTFLRLIKLKKYQKVLTLNAIFKATRIVIVFFLMVHWASCLWYLLVKFQYHETDQTESIWFPNGLRMIAETSDDLWSYYHSMEIPNVYAFTLLAIFMLSIGSDNAPVNQPQVYASVVIGLLGAMALSYVYALVTYIINRSNESHSKYEYQLESLKKKLKANKIPTNLRIKVLEYYNYTWRKNRILHKINDFSELSIPLQRDLAFYQNQKLVTKVPLFQELEPLEVLSIIQKLKTCVYMPGDKIIREGERGTEMYFIQEGVVEIIVKIITQNSYSTQQTTEFQKSYLGKENYFGEIALMSNSKRTSDANAFEFCILESFSRTDYNSLKKEFPDIGPRLKSGLKYYKSHRKDKLMSLLQAIPLFEGLTESELKLIIDDYTEELFIDPGKIILRPKQKTNALYFLFLGNVNCYADHEDTREYLLQLKKTGHGDKQPVVEEDYELDCIDDNILEFEKDKTYIEDLKKKLKLVRAYSLGAHFGCLDFGEHQIGCDHFYVSDNGCQLGAITQDLLDELMEDNIALYEKLKHNQSKQYPKATMVPIQEEAESAMSISMRQAPLEPRRSILQVKGSLHRLDMQKVVSGNGSSTHFEEEFVNFKTQFVKMQLDVDSLKYSMNDINYKLSRLLANTEGKGKGTANLLAKRKRNSLNIDLMSHHQAIEQLRNVHTKPSIEEVSEGSEESPTPENKRGL